MSQTQPQPGSNSAAAAAEPGAFSAANAAASPAGNLDVLTKHIKENFGAPLAPVLEGMLFRRGWLYCTVDEFYNHLLNHSTQIVGELSRTISEYDLLSGIEENLLKALFITHGQQQAVYLVQAMRVASLQERFEAIVSPAKLLKLISQVQQQHTGGNQQPSRMGSGMQSFGSQSGSSFGRMPSSPGQQGGQQGGQQQLQPQQQQQQSGGGGGGSAQPYRSNPPTPQRTTSFEGGDQQGQGQGQGAHGGAPYHSGHSTPTQMARTGSTGSWNISQGQQQSQSHQLSPYPATNRNQQQQGGFAGQQQHGHQQGAQGQQLSFQQHQQQGQYQHQTQDEGSYQHQRGGGHGHGYGQQQHPDGTYQTAGSGHQRTMEPSPRRGAPSAPTALSVDDSDLSPVGGSNPRGIAPIGLTPTQQNAESPGAGMNWADATEEDEVTRQRVARDRVRDEAELAEFLNKHGQPRLLDPLKVYSLAKLKSFSPKQFDTELKLRICSKAARQSLLDLLHPDGNYPPEPPIVMPKPASQQGKIPARSAAPDVASTKAVLGALNVRSGEKDPRDARHYADDDDKYAEYRGGRTGKTGDRRGHEDYSAQRDRVDPYDRRGGAGSRQGSFESGGKHSSGGRRQYEEEYYEEPRHGKREPPREKGIPSIPSPASKREQQATKDSTSTTRRQTGPIEVPAPRHGRRDGTGSGVSSEQHSAATTPSKDPREKADDHAVPFRPGSLTLVLNGVHSYTMDDLVVAVGRLGTVSYEEFIENDCAQFELSAYAPELLNSRHVTIRVGGAHPHTGRLRVSSIHVKKTGKTISFEQNYNQPCKYYFSKEGCNRGDECKYLHEDPTGERTGRVREKGTPSKRQAAKARAAEQHDGAEGEKTSKSSSANNSMTEKEKPRVTPPLPRSQTPPPTGSAATASSPPATTHTEAPAAEQRKEENPPPVSGDNSSTPAADSGAQVAAPAPKAAEEASSTPAPKTTEEPAPAPAPKTAEEPAPAPAPKAAEEPAPSPAPKRVEEEREEPKDRPQPTAAEKETAKEPVQPAEQPVQAPASAEKTEKPERKEEPQQQPPQSAPAPTPERVETASAPAAATEPSSAAPATDAPPAGKPENPSSPPVSGEASNE